MLVRARVCVQMDHNRQLNEHEANISAKIRHFSHLINSIDTEATIFYVCLVCLQIRMPS